MMNDPNQPQPQQVTLTVPSDVLRRGDEDWIQLKKAVHRMDRAVMGDWSDDGVTWLPGIRERLASLEKIARWFWLLVSAVWAVALGLWLQMANAVFHFLTPK